MALIRRLARIVLAYVVACLAAAFVMTIVSWLREGAAAVTLLVLADAMLWLTALSAGYFMVAACIPSLLAIVAAEFWSWRMLRIYALLGVGIALLVYNVGLGEKILGPSDYGFPHDMQDLIIGGGLIAGLVYWAVAGRKAGTRTAAEPVPTSATSETV